MEYKANKNTKFLIYGGGIVGRRIEDNLIKNGFEVIAFIDQNALQLQKKHSQKFYGPYDVPSNLLKHPVIIGVSNVFEHFDIAKQLFEIGFQYIIFKYMMPTLSYGLEKTNRLYDNIINDSIPKQFSLYSVPELMEETTKNDVLILRSNYDDFSVTVLVPVELLFMGKAQKYVSSELECLDTCILGLPAVVGLYHIFEGTIENRYREAALLNYKTYFHITNKEFNKEIDTDDSFNKHIENRYNVYVNMCEKFDMDTDFFISNPTKVEWNKKGYFNILDGMNRSAFQMSKGKTFIPCQMRKKDYECWKNEGYIVKDNPENIRYLQTLPIPEYIEKFRKDRSIISHKILKVLCQFISFSMGFEHMKNKKLIVLNEELLFLSHQLARMKSAPDQLIAKTNIDFFYRLNQLAYCTEINLITTLDDRISYDFGFILLTDNLDTDYLRQHINNIFYIGQKGKHTEDIHRLFNVQILSLLNYKGQYIEIGFIK